MMRAYDEIYLAKARTTLAWMFDYAVNGCGINLEIYYGMFLNSDYSKRFCQGDCAVVAGLSGVELAQRVIWEKTFDKELPQPVFSLDRSPEYWLGFFMAFYQWYSNLTFAQITENITITEILHMYQKYHEMDVMHFVIDMEQMREEKASRRTARLQEYRKLLGLSQRELAARSEVPLRTIQQYEQRQKNINHARTDYVLRLSNVLCCRPEDLLEQNLMIAENRIWM